MSFLMQKDQICDLIAAYMADCNVLRASPEWVAMCIATCLYEHAISFTETAATPIAEDFVPECHAKESGFICTRQKGHEGEHVANYNGSYSYHRWRNEGY